VTGPGERERVLTTLLDSWPWNLGGCLVGGYAVSAYGKPRYSQDADFVVPETARELIAEWVTTKGFTVKGAKEGAGRQRLADAQTFESDEATIDIMIGRVTDRGTRVSIPEPEVSLASRRIRLELISGSTETQVRVCRPEALWALKLVAARDQDLSDLFAISEEPVEFGLVARLQQVPVRLQSRKIFLDALSARSMRTKGQVASQRGWERFAKILEPLRSPETFPFDLD
jgi:hypothetical protein